MAHPKPSSRLLVQRIKGTRGVPLLDWGAIGGVGGGVKGECLLNEFPYFSTPPNYRCMSAYCLSHQGTKPFAGSSGSEILARKIPLAPVGGCREANSRLGCRASTEALNLVLS